MSLIKNRKYFVTESIGVNSPFAERGSLAANVAGGLADRAIAEGGMTIKRTIGKRIGFISALALLAACASVPALIATAQQTPAAASDTYIHAGRLLADPASGRVLTQQTILVRDGKIVSITAGYTSVPRGAKVVDLKSSFVLPGLIDSHVHITSEQGPDARLNQFMMTSSDGAIAGAGYALKTLQAGFTTVADLGADAEAILALRNGVAKGIIPGPRIITSAGAISVHGGHGDANGIPSDMVPLLRGPGVCSGADDCARATADSGGGRVGLTGPGPRSHDGSSPSRASHRR